MIRHLTGTVFETLDHSVIVSAQGVGYEVFIPSHAIFTLTTGTPVSFWIHHALREQSSDLYGFTNRADLIFFELLLTVSGVGPKSALAIMDKSSTGVLRRGISSQDSGHLIKVAGLSKKVAEKLILSLKDKIAKSDVNQGGGPSDEQEMIDAIDALISLGFSEKQARDAVQSMERGMTTPEMIRRALQTLR